MAEDKDKPTPNKLRNLVVVAALILAAVWLAQPEFFASIQTAAMGRWTAYQDAVARKAAEQEASRKLKVSAEVLEAELDAVNVRATLEGLRTDIETVKERTASIRMRFLAVQDKAEPVYGTKLNADGLAYSKLKSFGPTQIEQLNNYLEILDKADRGVTPKDALDYSSLLRRIARHNHQVFVEQYMMMRHLLVLERRFPNNNQ